MTALKTKPLNQYCLNSHFFNEVMQLPAEVKITEVQFEIGFGLKRHSLPISSTLAGCGVTSIRKSEPFTEVTGKVSGTRTGMKADMKEICKETGHDVRCARVRRMVVDVDGKQGVFTRSTKKVADGADGKVKNRAVLGLTSWDDKADKDIAKACQSTKYLCAFTTQPTRVILCEEKGIIK